MNSWIQIQFCLAVGCPGRQSYCSRWNARIRLLILCLFCFGWGGRQSNSQDTAVLSDSSPIVLRDLTLIRGKTVSDFNGASVVLSDGTRLTWDQILKATVGDDRQEEFDLQLTQIGLPLFRLKSRIGNGDWTGAGEIAGPIYDASIADTKPLTDDDTAYFVCLATMKSRIGKGDRAGALLPFIKAAQLQPKVSPDALKMVGSRGIPRRDIEFRLSHELLPVWFEDSKLQETASRLTEMLESLALRNEPAPPPGLTIYLASLKIELGQTEEALRLLRSLDSISDAEIASWQIVLEARIHQKTKNTLNAQTLLELNEKKITGSARLAAHYYLGVNVVDQPDTSDLDRSKAILTLLRIPAINGNLHRDLAAAAIFQSAKIAKLRGRGIDEQKLRDELLKTYPRTYHGLLESNQRSGQ